MTVRVAIQQRLRLMREGFGSLFCGDDVELTGTAVKGVDLVGLLTVEVPDVVVLEIDVHEWDPSQLAHDLQARWPSLKFVGTYREGAGADLQWARRSGFQWLASYETGSRAAFVEAVTAAAAHAPVPIRVRTGTTAGEGQLTKREVQILRFIGAGCTAREISDRMSITYKTVENHKQRIFCKLGVQNQAHAVSVAFRRGFLEPGSVLDLAADGQFGRLGV